MSAMKALRSLPPFAMVLLSVLLSTCAPLAGRKERVISDDGSEEFSDKTDSLVIVYERNTYYMMSEPPYYDELGRGKFKYGSIGARSGYEPYLEMKIENPEAIAVIDSCLNNSIAYKVRNGEKNDTLYHGRHRHGWVFPEYLLLRHVGERIDTFVLWHVPGNISLREDIIYYDVLVYHYVMKELAERDSVWLNRSRNGVIFYQGHYLGRENIEQQFVDRYYRPLWGK